MFSRSLISSGNLLESGKAVGQVEVAGVFGRELEMSSEQVMTLGGM